MHAKVVKKNIFIVPLMKNFPAADVHILILPVAKVSLWLILKNPGNFRKRKM